MPVLISGAVAADVAIANALQPPTRGIGGGVTIPSDWFSRSVNGERIPGCTTHSIEGTTMLVTPTVQTRIKDAALVASLGLNSAQVAAFKTRIASGTYVATPGEEFVVMNPRKVGVAAVPLVDGGSALNPWTAAQQKAALEGSQVSYWHNFEAIPEVILPLSTGAQFIPMLGLINNVNSAAITAAVANAQANRILFLGEPDGRMVTVQQAVDLWNTVTNHSAITSNPQIKLCSPYTAADGSLANSWLKQWFTGIAGMRQPDAVGLDRYTGTVSTFMQRVTDYHAAFGLPIWIGEFAPDSGADGVGGLMSQANEVIWMQALSRELDRCDGLNGRPNVEMYFLWYLGPKQYTTNGFALRALFDNAGVATSPLNPTWQQCGRLLPI